MFSKFQTKSQRKSLEDFDHLAIDPIKQSFIRQQYESWKFHYQCFHKNYFIIQREHALAKEKLRYQQELLVRLRKKYDKIVQKEGNKEFVLQMCRDRIVEEESLLEEYRKNYEKATKNNRPYQHTIVQARTRIEQIVAREVSTFEKLKKQQRIVMYLASVAKEEVQAVGRSRFQETFELLEQIQKRETQKPHLQVK